jgi:hypothetical protein
MTKKEKPHPTIIRERTIELIQEIENLKHIAKNFPEQMVGSKIYVYWPKDDLWYLAKVVKFNESSFKFSIVYDVDGINERIDLQKHLFFIYDKNDKSLMLACKKSDIQKRRGPKPPESSANVPVTFKKTSTKKVLGKRKYKRVKSLKGVTHRLKTDHTEMIKPQSLYGNRLVS